MEGDVTCPVHDTDDEGGRGGSGVRVPGAVIVRTSLLYGDRDLTAIQRDVADAIVGRSSMRFFTDEQRCPIHADDVAGALIS